MFQDDGDGGRGTSSMMGVQVLNVIQCRGTVH